MNSENKLFDGELQLGKESKKKFQVILNVINIHYTENFKGKSNDLEFRILLAKSIPESIEVFVSSMEIDTFQIRAVHLGIEKIWIHVDGIEEERRRLREKSIFSHPLYDITCLTDIVEEELRV